MKQPSKRKKESVEQGKRAAVSDLDYRFNFIVNRRKMNRFMALAKLQKTDAAALLNEYIDTYLTTHKTVKL